MTIETSFFDRDYWTVECDGNACTEEEEYCKDDGWDAMMQSLNDCGWSMRKVNGDWEHSCYSCTQNPDLNHLVL